MNPRPVWPKFDASVSTTTKIEHFTEILRHTRALRRHFEETAQKTLPKNTCVELFYSLDQLTSKLYAQIELEKFEERVLGDLPHMHRDLSNAIIKMTASKAGPARQYEGQPSTDHERPTAADLSLVVKHVDKCLAERLRPILPPQLVFEVNRVISKNREVSRLFSGTSTLSPDSRVVGFQHLRSGDVKLFLRKEEDATVLRNNIHWVKMFGPDAKVQPATYGVVIHSVRVADLDLNTPHGKARAVENLVAENTTRIPELVGTVVHLRWLEKTVPEGGQTSLVLELNDPRPANAIIQRSFIWAGEQHRCERLLPIRRVKQCFQCWAYGHIGSKCLSTPKCGRCGEPGHLMKQCQVPNSRVKCAVCGGTHHSQSRNCRYRRAEVAKIRWAKSETSTLHPIKSAKRTESDTALTTQIFGDYLPPSSVAREGSQPVRTSGLDPLPQETTPLTTTTDGPLSLLQESRKRKHKAAFTDRTSLTCLLQPPTVWWS